MKGWICAKCGFSWSPFESGCANCNDKGMKPYEFPIKNPFTPRDDWKLPTHPYC